MICSRINNCICHNINEVIKTIKKQWFDSYDNNIYKYYNIWELCTNKINTIEKIVTIENKLRTQFPSFSALRTNVREKALLQKTNKPRNLIM